MSIIELIERRANRAHAEAHGLTLIEDLSPAEQKAIHDDMEAKARYVRTAAGVARFKRPIGAIILPRGIGSLDRIRIKDPVFKGFDLVEDRKGNLYDVGKDDSTGKYVALKHNTWDDQVEPQDSLDKALEALNEKLGGGTNTDREEGEKPAPKSKKPAPKETPKETPSSDKKPQGDAPSKGNTSTAEIVDGKFVITTPDGKKHTRTATGKKPYTHALIRKNKEGSGSDSYFVSFASDEGKVRRESRVGAAGRSHNEIIELPTSGNDAPKTPEPKKAPERTKQENAEISRRLKGAQDALDKFEKIKNDPYAQSSDYSEYDRSGKPRFAINGDFEQADMWLRNRDLLDKFTPEEREQAEKLRQRMRDAATEIEKDPSIMKASKSRAKERAEAIPDVTDEQIADARKQYRAVRSLSDGQMRSFLMLNEEGRKGYIDAFRQHRDPARAHQAGIFHQRQSRGQDTTKGGTMGGQGSKERDAFIESHPKLKGVNDYHKPKLRDLSEKNFRAYLAAVEGGKSPDSIGAIMSRVDPGASWNPTTEKWVGQNSTKRPTSPTPTGDTSASDAADAAVRDRVQKMKDADRSKDRTNPYTSSLKPHQKDEVDALTPGEYATYMNARDGGHGHQGAVHRAKNQPKYTYLGALRDVDDAITNAKKNLSSKQTPEEQEYELKNRQKRLQEANAELGRHRAALPQKLDQMTSEQKAQEKEILAKYQAIDEAENAILRKRRAVMKKREDQAGQRDRDAAQNQKNREARESAEAAGKFGNTATFVSKNQDLLKEVVTLGRSGKSPAPHLPEVRERLAEIDKRLAWSNDELGGYHKGKGKAESDERAEQFRKTLQSQRERYQKAVDLIESQSKPKGGDKPSSSDAPSQATFDAAHKIAISPETSPEERRKAYEEMHRYRDTLGSAVDVFDRARGAEIRRISDKMEEIHTALVRPRTADAKGTVAKLQARKRAESELGITRWDSSRLGGTSSDAPKSPSYDRGARLMDTSKDKPSSSAAPKHTGALGNPITDQRAVAMEMETLTGTAKNASHIRNAATAQERIERLRKGIESLKGLRDDKDSPMTARQRRDADTAIKHAEDVQKRLEEKFGRSDSPSSGTTGDDQAPAPFGRRLDIGNNVIMERNGQREPGRVTGLGPGYARVTFADGTTKDYDPTNGVPLDGQGPNIRKRTSEESGPLNAQERAQEEAVNALVRQRAEALREASEAMSEVDFSDSSPEGEARLQAAWDKIKEAELESNDRLREMDSLYLTNTQRSRLSNTDLSTSGRNSTAGLLLQRLNGIQNRRAPIVKAERERRLKEAEAAGDTLTAIAITKELEAAEMSYALGQSARRQEIKRNWDRRRDQIRKAAEQRSAQQAQGFTPAPTPAPTLDRVKGADSTVSLAKMQALKARRARTEKSARDHINVLNGAERDLNRTLERSGDRMPADQRAEVEQALQEVRAARAKAEQNIPLSQRTTLRPSDIPALNEQNSQNRDYREVARNRATAEAQELFNSLPTSIPDGTRYGAQELDRAALANMDDAPSVPALNRAIRALEEQEDTTVDDEIRVLKEARDYLKERADRDRAEFESANTSLFGDDLSIPEPTPARPQNRAYTERPGDPGDGPFRRGASKLRGRGIEDFTPNEARRVDEMDATQWRDARRALDTGWSLSDILAGKHDPANRDRRTFEQRHQEAVERRDRNRTSATAEWGTSTRTSLPQSGGQESDDPIRRAVERGEISTREAERRRRRAERERQAEQSRQINEFLDRERANNPAPSTPEAPRPTAPSRSEIATLKERADNALRPFSRLGTRTATAQDRTELRRVRNALVKQLRDYDAAGGGRYRMGIEIQLHQVRRALSGN